MKNIEDLRNKRLNYKKRLIVYEKYRRFKGEINEKNIFNLSREEYK